jgi:uncharacterized protein with GYD domain
MSKRKGARSEYKSRDLFILAGYRVTKAGGSLGEWDLIAIGPHDVILCQVKSNRWPGKLEMETLAAFPTPPNTKRLVHRWDNYAREPKVRIIG